MQKLLTIAIPAYNAEQYLEKCLTSLVNVTRPELLEIIVVNDGSIDSTEDLANEYIKRYPGIIKLISKENGGHGSAINVAAQAATGKYFKVIDADDWVITENLNEMLDILEQVDVDAVLTPYNTVNIKTGEIIHRNINCECNKIYSLEEMIDTYYSVNYHSVYNGFTLAGLFYKTEIYNSTGFSLSEKIFYEDNEFTIIPFTKVKSILPVNLTIYQYRIGNDNQSVSSQNIVKRIHHIRQVVERILEYKKANISPNTSVEKYFLLKLQSVIADYYTVALIRDSDKKRGKEEALSFRRYIGLQENALQKMTEKRFMILLTLHYLHVPENFYQRILDNSVYKKIRNIWRYKWNT